MRHRCENYQIRSGPGSGTGTCKWGSAHPPSIVYVFLRMGLYEPRGQGWQRCPTYRYIPGGFSSIFTRESLHGIWIDSLLPRCDPFKKAGYVSSMD